MRFGRKQLPDPQLVDVDFLGSNSGGGPARRRVLGKRPYLTWVQSLGGFDQGVSKLAQPGLIQLNLLVVPKGRLGVLVDYLVVVRGRLEFVAAREIGNQKKVTWFATWGLGFNFLTLVFRC